MLHSRTCLHPSPTKQLLRPLQGRSTSALSFLLPRGRNPVSQFNLQKLITHHFGLLLFSQQSIEDRSAPAVVDVNQEAAAAKRQGQSEFWHLFLQHISCFVRLCCFYLYKEKVFGLQIWPGSSLFGGQTLGPLDFVFVLQSAQTERCCCRAVSRLTCCHCQSVQAVNKQTNRTTVTPLSTGPTTYRLFLHWLLVGRVWCVTWL